MTDKIVDGINVSECSSVYTDSYNDLCCDSAICKDSPCKPSEMLCSFYVDHLKTKLEEKEQECEKLKETVKAYQEDRFCQGGCAIYQYDKIHKLTEALEEIEEIANKDFSHTACVEYKKQLKQILDIINKAKEQ